MALVRMAMVILGILADYYITIYMYASTIMFESYDYLVTNRRSYVRKGSTRHARRPASADPGWGKERQSTNLASSKSSQAASHRVATEFVNAAFFFPRRRPARLHACSDVLSLTYVKKTHRPSARDVSHRRRLRRLHAILPHAPCSGACVARNATMVLATFRNHMARCSAAGVVPPLPATVRRRHAGEGCAAAIS
jgi:hypothetical protein